MGIRETREYYLCYLMSCDDSSLFRCLTRIQAINFFRKVKYNLFNESIILTNISCYMFYSYLLGLFRLHARSLMTMFVCYNYADKFLHLYIETHEPNVC